MTLWAIVPVKPLRRGKSRLASVLSDKERAALNRKLLIHTLDTITQLPILEQVLVVSRDPEALALARFHGARTLLEDGAPHLNIALTRASAVASTYGAHSVLILPADLPQITADDVNAMVAGARGTFSVVIAPDYHHSGTNALLVRPPGLIKYSFGPNSFSKHLSQAEDKKATIEVIDLPSLAHDVDLPEDLAFLNGELDEWTREEEQPEPTGYYSEIISKGSVTGEP